MSGSSDLFSAYKPSLGYKCYHPPPRKWAPPPPTGTTEPNVTKDKEEQVYVRDKDRHKVNWIQETTSAPPLPFPASNKSPDNIVLTEMIVRKFLC
ncbi:hypothetical protein CsSME_00010355 [Camellia sinensis var. sinensis]